MHHFALTLYFSALAYRGGGPIKPTNALSINVCHFGQFLCIFQPFMKVMRCSDLLSNVFFE